MTTPEICAGEITFSQDNHCESGDTSGEFLKVKQHGMSDDIYWTISTENGEWSFESLEQLTTTINRAIRALTEAKE